MSVRSRKLIATIIALGIVLFSGLAMTAPSGIFPIFPLVTEGACNTSGECSFDISDLSETILLACDAPRASISWNKKQSTSFLIACDCQCTSHDNVGWLIDMSNVVNHKKIQKLQVGKSFTKEALEKQAGNISDLVSSHPLCERVDKDKLIKSIFVSLIKESTKSESQPYCFSPLYVIPSQGSPKPVINTASDNSLVDDKSFSDYILRFVYEFARTQS